MNRTASSYLPVKNKSNSTCQDRVALLQEPKSNLNTNHQMQATIDPSRKPKLDPAFSPRPVPRKKQVFLAEDPPNEPSPSPEPVTPSPSPSPGPK